MCPPHTTLPGLAALAWGREGEPEEDPARENNGEGVAGRDAVRSAAAGGAGEAPVKSSGVSWSTESSVSRVKTEEEDLTLPADQM